MNKKYLIILVISIVATVGFFIVKNQINEKEVTTHTNREYENLIALANKSSIAGMSQMGQALNKFREERGAYPAKLSALYPDYIPVKAFIDDIQWYYEPRGNDFYLKKTYRTEKNKVLTAAIGSDLRLQQGSIVALFDKSKKISAPGAAKPVIKKLQPSPTLASAKQPGMAETDTTDPNSSRRQATGTNTSIHRKNTLPQKRSPYERELVSLEQLSKEEQFVERVKGNFLVWKKEDGTVVFGNVQYPNSDNMKIYDQGEWIQIRNRGPNSHAEGTIQQAREGKATTADRIVAAYSNRFLTWKNPEGTVCFGNVQYPNTQNIQIHAAGRWQSTKDW